MDAPPGTPLVDLSRPPAGVTVLRRTLATEPGDRFLLLEGAGAAGVELRVDGRLLNREGGGRFRLPPLAGPISVEIRFLGDAAPITAVWVH
jgi:hypothetical protein